MTQLPATPGQTVGPFFHYGLEFDRSDEVVDASAPGAIRLYGVIFDGNGDPVPDALIEIWQTDAAGNICTREGSLHRDGFTGFGRALVDAHGRYEFTTIEPGSDFFAVTIFARGLLDVLHTRIYLPGRSDAFLSRLSPAERGSLVAQRTSAGLQHDIHLQGESETVFLDYR
jgi:protocatechuate 3,4-dioxygenase, alpha subunit